MIQSWENLVTDGWADRQTDKSDFIGRPTNVERPKRNYSSSYGEPVTSLL